MKSIALCLLLAGAVAAQQTGHCKELQRVESCKNIHTMCAFRTSVDIGNCKGPVQVWNVTADDKDDILSLHNRIREDVRTGMYASSGLPAATKSLPPLQWDAELATIAQRAADHCVNKDYGMCNDVARFEVGLNDVVIWAAADKSNWTEAVENRFFTKELKNFNQDSLKFDQQSKNYASRLSQLLWAGTTKVGCGYIRAKVRVSGSKTGNEFRDFHKHYYICLYGPAGNIEGQYIYK